ncbi:MAG: sulfatase-like hydrolase/transferase [Verrucomicrobiota bacterium]
MKKMLVAVGVLLALCAPSFAAAPPNIVLVVADDMGYGDTTANWKTDLKTPAIDEIARQGIRFTQFRVNPLCAPTRASVMTGLYSLECGMWRGPGEDSRGPEPDAGWPESARRIKDDILLLPQLLKKAGYATGMFGKWHLGYDAKNLPNARGFDEFVGFLGGAHPYWLGRNSRILRNGQPYEDAKGHTTDLFADHAIAFIKANRDKPFFCYVPFNAVHGPLRSEDRDADSGKPEWLARYEKEGVAQPRRDYNAVMSHCDARVGDIVKTLRELGLESKTLVIFISDNGGILEKYPSNNGPLRGGKGTTYEGGIRVPAVMQWPGVIPPDTISDANAVHFDLFATILDAAGVRVRAKNGGFPVHGLSLLPLAKSGGKAQLPDRYLFWDLYGDIGALHGKWKLVGEIPNHHGKFDVAVRNAESTKFALFDLAADIGEKTDLVDKHPEIYRDLKARHLEWLRQFAK